MGDEEREPLTIPSARPLLDAADLDAILRIVGEGSLAAGQEVASFERALAAFLGRPDAVGVASGFAALHLALLSLGIGPGDDVIVPCVSSCPAIRDAVFAAGARPVFADTLSDVPNLSPVSVRAVRTAATRAVITAHHLGVRADVEALCDLGIPVVEDAAQLIDDPPHGQLAHMVSDVAVFSFYPTKLLTTIDGGALVAKTQDVTDRARRLRYYGGRFDLEPALNYKLQNLNAALGLTQLRKLPGFLRRRRELDAGYRNAIREVGVPPGIVIDTSAPGCVPFRFTLRLPTRARGRVQEELARAGVPSRCDLDFVCERDGVRFPNAARLIGEMLSLPLYPALEEPDVERIADALRGALGGAVADGLLEDPGHEVV